MKVDYSEVRRLLRLGLHGALGTHSASIAGYPFTSSLPYALDGACRPLFLISGLAEHTRNLLADPRASLLVLEGEGGFLEALKDRVLKRAHAVILVAEGAGQHLMADGNEQYDASGNLKSKDIGLFLREHIESYFNAQNIPFVLRYFDPSYMIRSVPACAEDAVLCDFYARNAVHAAMAGKTGLVIGFSVFFKMITL